MHGNTGRKWSNEYKELFRKQKLGTRRSSEVIEAIRKGNYKKVYQYDLEGNFIKEWESAKHIEKELNIKSSNISVCCSEKGKYLSAKSFRWSYNKLDKLDKLNKLPKTEKVTKCKPNIEYKVCRSCGENLYKDNFWKQPNNADGLFGKCKICSMKLVSENEVKNQKIS